MTPAELGQIVGQAVTLLTSAVAIVVALVTKKTRSPADDQARAEFGYRVLKERYDESVADRAVLSETVKYLQEQGREDFDREQKREELIRSLNQRITELERQIGEYESRMGRLAEKVRRGEEITLRDIYGEIDTGLGDLEDTITSS